MFSFYGPQLLWYRVVRDYKITSYQYTPTLFTSHKLLNTSITHMHYTMCCGLFFNISKIPFGSLSSLSAFFMDKFLNIQLQNFHDCINEPSILTLINSLFEKLSPEILVLFDFTFFFISAVFHLP